MKDRRSDIPNLSFYLSDLRKIDFLSLEEFQEISETIRKDRIELLAVILSQDGYLIEKLNPAYPGQEKPDYFRQVAQKAFDTRQITPYEMERSAESHRDLPGVELLLKNLDRNYQKVAQAYAKFALKTVRKMGIDSAFLEDAIQEANIALIKAARGFDYQPQGNFSRYAQRAIAYNLVRISPRYRHPIVLPEPAFRQLFSIIRAYKKLRKDDSEISSEDIATDTGIDAETVERLRIFLRPALSLDQPIGHNGQEDISFGDVILQETFMGPEDIALDLDRERKFHEAIREIITELSPRLTPKQRELLALHYGINDPESPLLDGLDEKTVVDISTAIDGNESEGLSLYAIASLKGISKQAAQQTMKRITGLFPEKDEIVGLTDYL